MEGIPSYVDDDQSKLAEKHGLRVGDTAKGGIGPDVEVVEMDAQGCKFSDGSTADHRTICINMKDKDLL